MANYRKRYGNLRKYRRQCAIAHKSTYGKCCVCLTAKSEELHHAFYGKDIIGISTFPVCKRCHTSICHSPQHWKRDNENPIWGNKNTPQFLEKLQMGYRLLYEGINHHA